MRWNEHIWNSKLAVFRRSFFIISFISSIIFIIHVMTVITTWPLQNSSKSQKLAKNPWIILVIVKLDLKKQIFNCLTGVCVRLGTIFFNGISVKEVQIHFIGFWHVLPMFPRISSSEMKSGVSAWTLEEERPCSRGVLWASTTTVH